MQQLAKMEANREKLKEMVDSNTKATQEESGQAEMRSAIGAIGEKMDAWIANMENDLKERTSCRETTETHLKCEEQTSAIMESEEKPQEAPKQDAIVKPVKGRKKRHRGRKPAAGRRGEPKELTRSDYGSGKKLAAAC
jgi:hypothetical protein